MTINKVNNVPDYAMDSIFWVVRACDGEVWFYGAYDTENRAFEVADMVGGRLYYNR